MNNDLVVLATREKKHRFGDKNIAGKENAKFRSAIPWM